MEVRRKCDPELGRKVNEHLISLGLETPMKRGNFNSEKSIKNIEGHFEKIMDDLGLDLEDDSLCDTPKRVAQIICVYRKGDRREAGAISSPRINK